MTGWSLLYLAAGVLFVMVGAGALRRPRYILEDRGLRWRTLTGPAMVRWTAVTDVTLGGPGHTVIRITAPGGIENAAGRRLERQRISVISFGLTVHPSDLYDYIVERVGGGSTG